MVSDFPLMRLELTIGNASSTSYVALISDSVWYLTQYGTVKRLSASLGALG